MRGSSGRGFLTRMGFRNIRSNRTMSIASVLVLVSCLMLIGLVFLAAVNLRGLFTEFSSRNVIMVYLFPGLEPRQMEDIGRRIEGLEGVKGCEFISSEEAKRRALEKNQGDFALLEGIQEEFMPNAFEVFPASQTAFEETVRQLQALDPGVYRVRHFQEVANQLAAIERALTIFGAAVIGVLMLVSVFIISSTVQATMYSRQQEIKVMKSVGAAPAFIRWPFLVEGIALGVLGSFVGLGVVLLVYWSLGRALEPLLGRLLGGFALVPITSQLPWLLPGFIGVGVLTGGGGSMLSITRYLKEKVYEKSELDD